jgi:hypothetical protein
MDGGGLQMRVDRRINPNQMAMPCQVVDALAETAISHAEERQ